MSETEEEKKNRLIAEFDKLLVETSRPFCTKEDCTNHKVETFNWKTIIRRGTYRNKTSGKDLPRFQCKLCGAILRFKEKSLTEVRHKYVDVPLKIFNELCGYKTQRQLASDYETSHKTMMHILDALVEAFNEIWHSPRFLKGPHHFVVEREVGLHTSFPQTVFFSFDIVKGWIDGVEVIPFNESAEEKNNRLESLMWMKALDEVPSRNSDEDDPFKSIFEGLPCEKTIPEKPTYKIIGPNSYKDFISVQNTEGTAIDLSLFDSLRFEDWQSFKSDHEARQKMILFSIAHNNHLKHLKKSTAA